MNCQAPVLFSHLAHLPFSLKRGEKKREREKCLNCAREVRASWFFFFFSQTHDLIPLVAGSHNRPLRGNDIPAIVGKGSWDTLMRMFTREPHDARCKWEGGKDANEAR